MSDRFSIRTTMGLYWKRGLMDYACRLIVFKVHGLRNAQNHSTSLNQLDLINVPGPYGSICDASYFTATWTFELFVRHFS